MQQKAYKNVLLVFFLSLHYGTVNRFFMEWSEMGLSAAATIHLLSRSNTIITELRLEGVQCREALV